MKRLEMEVKSIVVRTDFYRTLVKINMKNNLNESSTNSILQWLINNQHILVLTRIGKKVNGFTHEENLQKNKLMVAELLLSGYGVVKIKGDCPEGVTDETSEDSYLVVNRNNDENFLTNLSRISEYYNQDLVYYKEKDKTKGDLIGTNNCGWPDIDFWRNMIGGGMLVKENIHPLTSKTMGEELRKMREAGK